MFLGPWHTDATYTAKNMNGVKFCYRPVQIVVLLKLDLLVLLLLFFAHLERGKEAKNIS